MYCMIESKQQPNITESHQMDTTTASTFGLRLKQERRRLGLTQAQFAETCQVRKGTQLNYELDLRAPDSTYLSHAATMGVDISFLITGIHGNTLLGETEHNLLNHFRALDANCKAALLNLLQAMPTACNDH